MSNRVQGYFAAKKAYRGRRAEFEADRQQARTPSFLRKVPQTQTHKSGFFALVYALVRQIPAGSVTTYGDIARALGTRDLPAGRQAHAARTVGWALHANKDPHTPCHRVVARDGRLAPHYAFGGSLEQYARLKEEGVTFLDREHVDLARHHYTYPLTS